MTDNSSSRSCCAVDEMLYGNVELVAFAVVFSVNLHRKQNETHIVAPMILFYVRCYSSRLSSLHNNLQTPVNNICVVMQ